MSDDDIDTARAMGNDLKARIIDLIENHPARRNSAAIMAPLLELSLMCFVDLFGLRARQMWIDAYDSMITAERERGAEGTGS